MGGVKRVYWGISSRQRKTPMAKGIDVWNEGRQAPLGYRKMAGLT
ncbi:hypothetical protein [Paenibacillus lactis]